ncbi:MAG: hypothetical protein J5965_16595 [Aeriscardovia sp.]|nr:hypothetical protein [Aeriscardovia sp.]
MMNRDIDWESRKMSNDITSLVCSATVSTPACDISLTDLQTLLDKEDKVLHTTSDKPQE